MKWDISYMFVCCSSSVVLYNVDGAVLVTLRRRTKLAVLIPFKAILTHTHIQVVDWFIDFKDMDRRNSEAEPGGKQHVLAGKTIFVVGAGVAGLAFARGIRKHGNPELEPPTIVIYDRDSPDSATWREGNNYTFSVSGYSEAGGLVALKKLGVIDSVFSSAVSGLDGSGSFTIWGSDWSERLRSQRPAIAGLPTPSIRIVRKELRRILIDAVQSCPLTSIQWATKCVNVERTADARVRLFLQTGHDHGQAAFADCDLLIAADGASSNIRTLLRPVDNLEYIGAVLRGGLAHFPEGVPRLVRKDWGFMISNTGVSCFISPVDATTVLWAVGHREDEPTEEITPESTEDERRAVIDEGARLGHVFHEPFHTMTQQTAAGSVLCINGRDKRPFCHENINDMPVVFIGDSNHALSPFAGFGANLALADAYDLAEQLCGSHKTLGCAVEAYDRVSEPRARKMWMDSRRNVRAGHSTGLAYWVFVGFLFVGNWVRWLVGKVRGWGVF
jgi:2-polyprenyl-6-methoxyphenol hydroxylase-like FAD-dependent oxidoreductase